MTRAPEGALVAHVPPAAPDAPLRDLQHPASLGAAFFLGEHHVGC